jgi:mRNA interferase HigB
LVTFCIFASMRVIAVRTLKEFWEKNPKAKDSLLSWFEATEAAVWNSPNELKQQFRNASIVNEKRVVFNIHGNSYRLIVDIEYRLKIVFVVWLGSHRDYDKIDAKKVNYER